MLRFPSPPDPVFTAILHDALEEMHNRLINLQDADDAADAWRASYPSASKVFSLPLATETIERLREASKDPGLYQITDYHWLLIYCCLRSCCDVHNDFVDENGGPIPVGPYRIGKIDFDALADLYFWDTDFLSGSTEVAGLGPEGRQMMGMSAEVFGIAQGLTPHPEELKIERWEEPEPVNIEPAPPAGAVIPRFPPEPEDEYEDGEHSGTHHLGPSAGAPTHPLAQTGCQPMSKTPVNWEAVKVDLTAALRAVGLSDPRYRLDDTTGEDGELLFQELVILGTPVSVSEGAEGDGLWVMVAKTKNGSLYCRTEDPFDEGICQAESGAHVPEPSDTKAVARAAALQVARGRIREASQ